MKLLLVIFLPFFAVSTSAQGWNLTGGAAAVSWNIRLQPLGPGWHSSHPIGMLGVERGRFFAEAGGDPHAYKEANSWAAGIKFNILRRSRVDLYGRFGVGEIQTASFEYYGNRPNYCWWWTLSAGAGFRIRASSRLSIDVLRADYLSPYEVPARFRVSSGFAWRF